MRELSGEQARTLRVRASGLDPGARPWPSAVADVVAGVGALQAQETPAARLGVRARSDGLRAADVDRALAVDRSVVRGWFHRGTLHLVPAADARWLLDLLGPVALARGRRRRVQLGLDEDTLRRGGEVAARAVADEGPLTRAELVGRLRAAGVALGPDRQAEIHLLAHATLRGVLCHGPERDGEATYVRRDDWLPAAPPRDPDDALAALARRHLAAAAPADVADLAAWSGLPMPAARRAWALTTGERAEVRIAGRPAAVPRSWLRDLPDRAAGATGLRLLPAFDAYLLSHRTRDLAVDPAHARLVRPGGGLIRPVVIVEGRAAGTWTIRPVPALTAFPPVPGAAAGPLPAPAVAAELADVTRFLS